MIRECLNYSSKQKSVARKIFRNQKLFPIDRIEAFLRLLNLIAIESNRPCARFSEFRTKHAINDTV